MLVPMVTVLIGMLFFLAPRQFLNYMGLRAKADCPEAFGEGRSSFAGILLAVGLSCLLLQEPLALQPGLNFVLALGWTLAAVGRILQMVFDGGLRRKRIQSRFLLAATLAFIAWISAEVPQFVCVDGFSLQCGLPEDRLHIIIYSVALLTLILGLVALLTPRTALDIMRLESRVRAPFGVGEPRGSLGGMYTALGATVLMTPQPLSFVALMLGAAWLFTGIGRAVSMLLDRGITLYNLLGTLFEIGAGIAVLGLILGWF